MEVILEISKEEVYAEVSQTTSYAGSKMDGDDGAYDRIFTTDEDQSQLERFWNESCVRFSEVMKRYLVNDSEVKGADNTIVGHRFEMDFSRSFDAALLPSIRQELFSYFVTNITGKWYVFTNKKEAGDYAAGAASLLEGIHRKVCYKRKPQRPVYS